MDFFEIHHTRKKSTHNCVEKDLQAKKDVAMIVEDRDFIEKLTDKVEQVKDTKGVYFERYTIAYSANMVGTFFSL